MTGSHFQSQQMMTFNEFESSIQINITSWGFENKNVQFITVKVYSSGDQEGVWECFVGDESGK